MRKGERESLDIIGVDNLRRDMGKNEVWDSGWTAEMVARERGETQRDRDLEGELREWGCEEK